MSDLMAEQVQDAAAQMRQMIEAAQGGDSEAATWLDGILPSWRQRLPSALQALEPTLQDSQALAGVDLDEQLSELGGLSRREFASKYGVSPAYLLAEPTPEIDLRRSIADALGVVASRIPDDLIQSMIDEGVYRV